MSAAEVVYSNEEITMERGNTDGSANSPIETTYSEFGIVRRRPSTELPEYLIFSDGRCRVTSERAAVFVLSVILAAYLITLGLNLYKNNQTKENLRAVEKNLKVCSTNYTILQKMIDERDAEIKNLTGDSCTKCPVGWERYGGKCYYFSTNKATWSRSRNECRHQRGDLVKIESREEQEFLEQKARVKMTAGEDKFWIGLTDSKTEDTWLWTDGSPLDNSLKFWCGAEPDNYKEVNPDGEDCARMGERGRAAHVMCWFDASCEDPHKSICEKPEDS